MMWSIIQLLLLSVNCPLQWPVRIKQSHKTYNTNTNLKQNHKIHNTNTKLYKFVFVL